MRLVRAICFLFCAAVAPAAAHEGPVADLAVASALDKWLTDDDQTSLPELAHLAGEGHEAPRLLLALIDRMPETHAPWLAALPRAERIALMRAPDGRSWIAEDEGELARLWRTLWDADTPLQTALDFVDLGEPRAARLTLLAHAARQRGGFAELARDPRYPPELRYLAWAEVPDAPETAAEIAALPRGDPQAGRLDASATSRTALADWLLSSPTAETVARFCLRTCRTKAVSCALATYDGVGGYRGLLTLGPPSESLIPEDVWQTSVKGQRALLRRIALRRPPVIADQCLAEALDAIR